MTRRVRHGTDGRPIRGGNKFAELRYKYDERGNLTERRYLDADGKLEDGGTYAIGLYEYDERNLLIRQDSLDETGTPLKKGVARIEYRHDERGRDVRESYFDGRGKPTPNEDGVSVIETRYDDRGRLSELAFLGPDLKPALHALGYARRTVAYDGSGNPFEDAYYDTGGRLTARLEGFAKRRRRYDHRKLLQEVAFFNAGGAPTKAAYGVARLVLEYDASGEEVRRTLFDERGQPIEPPPLVVFTDIEHEDALPLPPGKGPHGKAHYAFVVTSLDPNGSAARAGVRMGDIIVRWGDEKLQLGSPVVRLLEGGSSGARARGAAPVRVVLHRWSWNQAKVLTKEIDGEAIGLSVTKATAITL